MIELNHLTKKFGDLVAVDDLSLKVERGEFFAVLGPNAAGKTTLIRVLAGLLKPTSGTARVAGFDVQADPLEARRRLAYVPDFPFLYDKLTPWEFLRFTGHIFQMSETRIQEASRALVPRFHLEPFISRPIEGLSHGTRQRVAIVSALLHDPEVLVIDEPMVGLDPQHARVVKDVLKERTRKRRDRLPFDPSTGRGRGNGRPHRHHAARPPGRHRHARTIAPASRRQRRPGGRFPRPDGGYQWRSDRRVDQ
jgi:ABC-2 type transport system ATP-binding protein